MFGLGHWELLIVLVVVVLLFGAKRIPEIARGVGQAITEFKKGARSGLDEVKREIDTPAQDDPSKKS